MELIADPKKYITMNRSNHIERYFFTDKVYLQELTYKSVGYETMFKIGSIEVLPEEENKYLEMIKKKRNKEIYWYRMGEYYFSIHNTEKAIDAYEKSLKNNPNFMISLFSIGSVHYEKGDFEKALSVFEDAYHHSKNLFLKKLAMLFIARTQEASLEYEASIETYNKILKKTFKKSKKKQILLKIATLYFRLEDFKNAIKCLYKTLKIDQEFSHAWNLLFKSFEYLDNYQDLIEYCSKILYSKCQNAYLWNNLGKAFLLSKNIFLSLSIFKTLFELYPNDDEICHNICLASIENKEYDEVIDLCNKILKYKKNDERILNYLGFAYFKYGLSEKAIEYINESIKKNQDNPLAFYYLSLIYKDLKDHESSLKYCRKSLDADPFYKNARDLYEKLST